MPTISPLNQERITYALAGIACALVTACFAIVFHWWFFVLPSTANASPFIVKYDTDNLFSENADNSDNGIELAIADYIDTAHTSLDVFIYSLRLESMTDALCNAVSRGVSVRIVAESDNAGVYHSQLEACGAAIVYDGNPNSLQHIKAIVKDGQSVFFGSQNFTNSGLNHDNGVMFEVNDTCIAGKFTDEFNHLYAGNWNHSQDNDPICHTPSGEWGIYFPPNDTQVEEVLTGIIRNTQETLAYASFVTTRDSIRYSLFEAHENGVEYYAIFDAHQGSQWYSATEDLCAYGFEASIDLWGGQWHHKGAASDAYTSEPVTVLGSMNHSTSGLERNHELFVVVRGDNDLARWYHRVITSAYTTLPDIAKCPTQPVNGEAGRYACNDGIDNDYDGYVDMVDFDCRESYEDVCSDGTNNMDSFDTVWDEDDVDCHWWGRVSPGVYVDHQFGNDIVIGWLYGQYELIEIYWQDHPLPWEGKPSEDAELLGGGDENRSFYVPDAPEGWYVVCGDGVCQDVYHDGDPTPQPN